MRGNQALDVIRQHLKRIPVAIYTGTPDVADEADIPSIGLFKKADITYKELIDKFWDIYNTGLTKIMGGKGQIEHSLSQIFINTFFLKFQRNQQLQKRVIGFLMQKKIQITRKKPYCVIHLIILFMNYIKAVKNCYPEEMYIHFPKQEQSGVRVDTGCILKEKTQNKFYIVLSPACDLVERDNGKCNTDRALLVEIQILDELLNDSGQKNFQ